MSVNIIEGSLRTAGGDIPFRAAANEQLELKEGGSVSVTKARPRSADRRTETDELNLGGQNELLTADAF